MNDSIKREDALRELLSGHDDVIYIDKDEAAKRIRNIPIVEPKQGKWISDIYKYGKERHCCSECGKGSIENYNYCPNCGARMKGADDENA